MTTIAVLGGGQLGRMLGLAGLPLGLTFRFLDPVPEAPAAAVGHLVVGPLDDEARLSETIHGAQVATYEWEGVPADAARLVERRVPVFPSPVALEVSQDRISEKSLFRELGIPTPEYRPVDALDVLHAALEDLGAPAILKTRRGGYDGKGQAVLHDESDVAAAWSALGHAPLVLEAFLPFEREVSILAVRGSDGATACWPLVENHHAGGILALSRAPAPGLTPALQSAAESIATRVLDRLGYVGVLAIELFQVGDTLLANEMAPRVHNSGHWTIEGAVTSQFENHLRAILGWPLGSGEAIGLSAMVNCIGRMPDRDAVLAIPGAHFHDYGKTPRPGRKLGHVTIVAPESATLEARLAAIPSSEA